MKTIRSILLTLLAVMLVACVGTDKPSDEVIKQAVVLELENKGVPHRWVKAGAEGTGPTFETIKVAEWGAYNEKKKRWPVKVHIVGKATLAIPFSRKKEVRHFDEVGEFYFYKDDFDKWQYIFNRPPIFGKALTLEEKEANAKKVLEQYGISVED